VLAHQTTLAIIRMANRVSVNPTINFNKKPFIGQSTPVLHPMKIVPSNNSAWDGTDRWSFISKKTSNHA